MSISWNETPSAIRVAGVTAILGFVVTIDSSSSRSVNGRLVECSYTNYSAIVFGVVALIAGIIGFGLARKIFEHRALLMAIAGVSAFIGLVHILRGIGNVGGPCNF